MKTELSVWRTKTSPKLSKSNFFFISVMLRVSPIQSKTKESQLRCWKLNITKKRSRKRPNNNKPPCWTRFMLTLKTLEVHQTVTTLTRTPPTKCVHTSSKAFVRKARNVYTLTTSHSTEHKKSTSTSTSAPSWSWTLSEEKNWVNSPKMN